MSCGLLFPQDQVWLFNGLTFTVYSSCAFNKKPGKLPFPPSDCAEAENNHVIMPDLQGGKKISKTLWLNNFHYDTSTELQVTAHIIVIKL